MATSALSFADLSDNDLLAAVHRLAVDERRVTANLIASLAELDARRLYLAEGCSSLFTYCTQILHLSEHAAYGRIEAARVTRKYPVAFERLEAGDITLTTIGLLAPHLTPDNHQHLIEAARHKSKREIEHLVATRRPQPRVPSTVRKLPDQMSERRCVSIEAVLADQPLMPAAGEASPAEPAMMQLTAKPAFVQPLGAERYQVQFTVAKETFEKLRRVQDLMRHACPSGRCSSRLRPSVDDVAAASGADQARAGITIAAAARHRAGLTPHPISSTTRGVGARRRPMRVRWYARSMHGAGLPRVSSCRAICGRRNRRR